MPDPTHDCVAEAQVVITDAQLETIIEQALEVQHGRVTAEGITLLHMVMPALFQELLDRRHAMAEITRVAAVSNVCEFVRHDSRRAGA